jgi:serine/threonine protein kinase
LNNEVNFEAVPTFFKVSEEAKDFIRLALTKDMNKRSSAKELLEHDWILK